MIFPAFLQPNDLARIIAPSGYLKKKDLDSAVKSLNIWGLKVEIASHAFDGSFTFSATDENRLNDLQDALDDPKVKLVLCARGGYGLTRILDAIDFSTFLNSPKWVVGFSDITALLQKLFALKIGSIHGPMGTSFSKDGAQSSIDALRDILFIGESIIETTASETVRSGVATGQLVGGNLALVCDSIGTTSELDTKSKILVLEEIGEHCYRVDRMLTQLDRAGKLSELNGLVLGTFSQLINEGGSFGETVAQMISRLTQRYSYPVALGIPIGHEPQNHPFVYGAEYRLQVDEYGSRLELQTKL